MSQLTINVINFLVIVRIFEKTNSTIAASFIWVAYAVPAIVVGPLGAAASDIWDRKKILVFSNLFQSIFILFFAFLYNRYIFLSYGIVAMYSFLNQFYVPAEAAALPRLVKRDFLPTANSLFFLSQQAVTILAFGLAGVVSESIGFRASLMIASLFLLIACMTSNLLPSLKVSRTREDMTYEENVYLFFRRMKEGYEFIRFNRRILLPFLFLMWLHTIMSVLVVNLPAIAEQIIKTRPALAGTMVVLPAGAGALIGTTLVPRLLNKFRKKHLVRAALLGQFLAFTVVSLIVPAVAFWVGRPLLILSFFVAGASFVMALVPTLTYMQEHTPPVFMGRVFGNFWFMTSVVTVLPVVFSATITELLGTQLMLATIGGGMLIALIATYRKFTQIHHHE